MVQAIPYELVMTRVLHILAIVDQFVCIGLIVYSIFLPSGQQGAVVGQWWEYTPRNNVALVQFWPSSICRLSLLLALAPPWGSLWLLQFSSLHKNQHTNSTLRIEESHKKPAMAGVASFPNVVIYYSIYFILPPDTVYKLVNYILHHWYFTMLFAG